MRKIVIAGLVLGLVGVTLWQLQAAQGSEKEPDYESLLKDGNFEVRKYPSLIAAQIKVSSTGKDAENQAFKILAGYIFGKNQTSEKVEMTVPVTTKKLANEKIAMTVPVTELVSEDGLVMRFFMPAKYTLETLPKPLDKRVELVPTPPEKYAVVKFSGLADEQSIKRETDRLLKFLETQSLKSSGTPQRAFYNPPWTLPFLRRNEVWIPLS